MESNETGKRKRSQGVACLIKRVRQKRVRARAPDARAPPEREGPTVNDLALEMRRAILLRLDDWRDVTACLCAAWCFHGALTQHDVWITKYAPSSGKLLTASDEPLAAYEAVYERWGIASPDFTYGGLCALAKAGRLEHFTWLDARIAAIERCRRAVRIKEAHGPGPHFGIDLPRKSPKTSVIPESGSSDGHVRTLHPTVVCNLDATIHRKQQLDGFNTILNVSHVPYPPILPSSHDRKVVRHMSRAVSAYSQDDYDGKDEDGEYLDDYRMDQYVGGGYEDGGDEGEGMERQPSPIDPYLARVYIRIGICAIEQAREPIVRYIVKAHADLEERMMPALFEAASLWSRLSIVQTLHDHALAAASRVLAVQNPQDADASSCSGDIDDVARYMSDEEDDGGDDGDDDDDDKAEPSYLDMWRWTRARIRHRFRLTDRDDLDELVHRWCPRHMPVGTHSRMTPEVCGHYRALRCTTELPLTPSVFNAVIENGHVDVARWMLDQPRAPHDRPLLCKRDSVNHAASQGHIQMVQWLHDSRIKRCSTATLVKCIRSRICSEDNVINLLQWATCPPLPDTHERGQAPDQRTLGGTCRVPEWRDANVAIEAATFDRPEVVRWLYETYPDAVTIEAMRSAARWANPDVLLYLASVGVATLAECDALRLAASSLDYRRKCLQYSHAPVPVVTPERVVSALGSLHAAGAPYTLAAFYSALHSCCRPIIGAMIQLYGTAPEMDPDAAMRDAAHVNHIDTMRFVRDNLPGARVCVAAAVMRANGDPDTRIICLGRCRCDSCRSARARRLRRPAQN